MVLTTSDVKGIQKLAPIIVQAFPDGAAVIITDTEKSSTKHILTTSMYPAHTA